MLMTPPYRRKERTWKLRLSDAALLLSLEDLYGRPM
jgi:hypothetical protein